MLFPKTEPEAENSMREQARRILVLETSTFRLTKKCFKICAGMESSMHDLTKRCELFYMPGKSDEYNESLEFFDECVANCAYNYAKYRAAVKREYMEDFEKVQKQNDLLFDSYYNEEADTEVKK